MNIMRRRFTEWYFRKWYGIKFNQIGEIESFTCPLYVKPFLSLFSPPMYLDMVWEHLLNGFINGLKGAKELCHEMLKERSCSDM